MWGRFPTCHRRLEACATGQVSLPEARARWIKDAVASIRLILAGWIRTRGAILDHLQTLQLEPSADQSLDRASVYFPSDLVRLSCASDAKVSVDCSNIASLYYPCGIRVCGIPVNTFSGGD